MSTQKPSPHSSEKLAWTTPSGFTLALLIAAGAVLRFLFLARKPFWFDEAFSVEIARMSLHDFARLLWWREANMSLYYILLRGWLHFGSSPFFIRSLSVLTALAALPAIYWLGCKLFDRRTGLIAAALLSFNAYHVRYAQEARSYSLFVLLATLSSGFFIAWLREPHIKRDRSAYILTSVLATYAHLYAVLLVASQWLAARLFRATRTSDPDAPNDLRVNRSAMRRAWLWIGIAVLPLLAFVGKTGAGQIRWIQRPGFHDLVEYWERLAGNDGLALLSLYAAACLAAIWPLRKTLFHRSQSWEVWRAQFLLLWLLFPVVLTVVLSVARPVFLGRYLIFCLPALIILAAAGLADLRTPWMQGVCLATILLLSLQGTLSYYDHDFDLERDGSEAAANYVYDHAQPGDAIVFHIAEGRIPYEFVGSLRQARAPGARPEVLFPRHGESLDYRDVTGKPSSDVIRAARSQHSRVWLVLMSNGAPGHPDATTTILEQALRDSFARIERMEFPQVEVTLYARP